MGGRKGRARPAPGRQGRLVVAQPLPARWHPGEHPGEHPDRHHGQGRQAHHQQQWHHHYRGRQHQQWHDAQSRRRPVCDARVRNNLQPECNLERRLVLIERRQQTVSYIGNCILRGRHSYLGRHLLMQPHDILILLDDTQCFISSIANLSQISSLIHSLSIWTTFGSQVSFILK